MKRLYTILIVLLLMAPFAAAQITTERCFHLDKVQFLQHKQDFWRSHKLYSTAARDISTISGGYYNVTEFNYGFGLERKDAPFADHFLGITTVNGWRFGNGFAIGGGVGFLSYGDYYDDGLDYLLPLYADARYFIGKQKNKFFVMLDGGILLNFEDFDDNSRYFANPGLGISIPLSQSTQLTFTAGLLTQYDFDYFVDKVEGYRDTFINMKLGLIFGK
jgi:hypothetical protein